MKSGTVAIIVCSLVVALCSCAVMKRPPVVAGVQEEAVPPIAVS
jgi:hypothetical protein